MFQLMFITCQNILTWHMDVTLCLQICMTAYPVAGSLQDYDLMHDTVVRICE